MLPPTIAVLRAHCVGSLWSQAILRASLWVVESTLWHSGPISMLTSRLSMLTIRMASPEIVDAGRPSWLSNRSSAFCLSCGASTARGHVDSFVLALKCSFGCLCSKCDVSGHFESIRCSMLLAANADHVESQQHLSAPAAAASSNEHKNHDDPCLRLPCYTLMRERLRGSSSRRRPIVGARHGPEVDRIGMGHNQARA